MKKNESLINKRVGVLGVVTMSAFLVMVGQLGNLTLRQQMIYAAQATVQQTRTIQAFAPRGSIYDRNMQPLAIDRPTYQLYLQAPYYNQPDVVNRLAHILKRPVEDLQKQIIKVKDLPYSPAKLADSLAPEQYTSIVEQKQTLPGVEVRREMVRYYPNTDLAAQVLGYLGETGDGNLQQTDGTGYLPGEITGKTGLEEYYEADLRGIPGWDEVLVDIEAKPIGLAKRVEPTPGHNLVLTLDSWLQRVAERALDWQMHRLQTIPNAGDGHVYPNAKAGAAVVLDVKTGAVLALASRPSFDPNLFVGGISDQDWNRLIADPYLPMLNRTIQAAYQPGSTWKMLTGSAAVAAGVTTPSEKVFSGTAYAPTGQRDWVPSGHGWVDLPNALRLSSDIYFYEMGRRLGIDRLVQYATGFGFGSPTGIDLGGEVAGFVPDEAYRKKTDWFLGQTTSAGIGQIFTVTPLQLARYVSALANGSKLMRPYLVQSMQDAQGNVIRTVQPEQTGTLPVPADVLGVVVQGMRLVDGPTGTSDFALWPLPGIATAGKTGTAENPPKEDYGLYVGFAPADNPQIAVAVVIEQAGHGSSVSPVARSIYAEYFGVQLPKSDPAYIPDTSAPM